MVIFGTKRVVIVIGAGLVGAHYIKRLIPQGVDIVATVKNLEKEYSVFERRVFNYNKHDKKETELGSKRALIYSTDSNTVTLTSLDIFTEGVEPILSSLKGRTLDHVINSINLGTLYGMKALNNELSQTEIFELCMNINSALIKYAKMQKDTLTHLLVSTTGSGGIGLERMRISHNLNGLGIPPSIVLKSQKAAEILSILRDFRRSNPGTVIHQAIVPASAIIDLNVYDEPVETYGDYQKLIEGQFLKAFSPNIKINDKIISELKEIGLLYARYGLFGEDGPHTVADLQQLEMFMGVTSATKIAQLIEDTIRRRGSYDYDVLKGGAGIPEQSEYAVFSFEQRAKNKENGKYTPITLSPIAPFDITLRCFAYELLADVGFEKLKDFASCNVNDETIKTLAGKIQEKLENNHELLIASTSLGVAYDLSSDKRYCADGKFTRGIISNTTIKESIEAAKDFIMFKNTSFKLNDFIAAYETHDGISTKRIIGYLAAYPVAKEMQKGGHF